MVTGRTVEGGESCLPRRRIDLGIATIDPALNGHDITTLLRRRSTQSSSGSAKDLPHHLPANIAEVVG